MSGSRSAPPAELLSFVNTTNLQLLNLNRQLLDLSRTLLEAAPVSCDEREALRAVLVKAAADADETSIVLESMRRDIARYLLN